MLLESVTTGAPEERLDEKLAQLTFMDINDDCELLLVCTVSSADFGYPSAGSELG